MTLANMSWIVVAVLAVSTGLLWPTEGSPIMGVNRRHGINSRDFDNTIASAAGSKVNNPVNERSTPLVRCYCNMPACLAASGGVQTCTTRLGCFSQLKPNIPNIDGTVNRPVTTTTSTTTKKTTMIPEELDVEAAIYANDDVLNGAYGCLDLFLNKTCDEVLSLMEDDESEFPSMPTENFSQSLNSEVSAYHCCQEDMCNDRSHVAATASNVEAALIAAFQSTMYQKDDSKLKTDSPPMLPVPAALVKEYNEEIDMFGIDRLGRSPPTATSSTTTPETITSAPEAKATTSTAESTNTEIPTDSARKSAVVDTNLSTESTPTPSESASVSGINVTSTEATYNVSSTNVSSTEAILSTNILSTEATTVLRTNITSNETTYDTIVTSTEGSSVTNANVTSDGTALTGDTIAVHHTPVVKTTAIEDSEAVEKNGFIPITDDNTEKTSSIFRSPEVNVNENMSTSINNSSSGKEMNITAAVIELIDVVDAVATTTVETPTTLMPNISEEIMSEAITTLPPSAIVNTNIKEVMDSRKYDSPFLFGVGLPGEIEAGRHMDLFPFALPLHKSADDETTSDATSQEAGLSGIKSASQVNDSHSPADPLETSQDVAHQKSTNDAAPPATGVLGLTGIPQWVEGVTGILALCGIIGVTLAALAAIKIIRKTDVFENYKSVCSNPGQPCACGDGVLGSRRSRQLTSSSGVYRKTTGPVLPPPNKPNKNLYGLAYIDKTGNSTHVYTPIPAL